MRSLLCRDLSGGSSRPCLLRFSRSPIRASAADVARSFPFLRDLERLSSSSSLLKGVLCRCRCVRWRGERDRSRCRRSSRDRVSPRRRSRGSSSFFFSSLMPEGRIEGFLSSSLSIGVFLSLSSASLCFRFRPARMEEMAPSWRRRMSPAVGLSFRRFFSSATVRSSRRAWASAASLARRAALWFVVSLMMRPRNRVLGLALFAGLVRK